MNRAKPLALVAVLFVTTVELLRAGGPLLDALAGPLGIEVAAVVALVLFGMPGALLITLRRVSLPLLVGMVLLVRVLAQFLPALAVVGAGAVLTMAALAIAVQRAGDPVTAVSGVLAGGALDLGIRSATYTWDPIWAGVWGLPMVVLPMVALWLSLSVQVPDRDTHLLGRVWALGVYLALWTTTVGNPAFVASQSGIALQVCLLILLAGLAASVELVRHLRIAGGTGRIPEPDGWYAGSLAALGLLVFLTLAWWGSGPLSIISVAAAQMLAAVCLARALAWQRVPGWITNSGQFRIVGDSASAAGWTSPSGQFRQVGRRPASIGRNGAYGLLWVLPVLLFQLHYDMPLPFDNRLVIVVFVAPLGIAAVGRRVWPPMMAGKAISDPRPAAVQWLLPVASTALVARAIALLLLVPALVLITPVQRAAAPAEVSAIKLMSWNVKYGRDDSRGVIDPRQIAEAIRAAQPDVVVLQEVSRGWAIGGGMDLAEYVAHDLGMSYRWGPAADRQFGNLLLTNLPLSDVQIGRLPYGQGPMHRSFLKFRIRLNPVTEFDLMTTHLTHRKQNTPTRLDQIDMVLRERPTVLAGDLNFWPTWDEPRSFARAGYISAQDVTGNGTEWTSPTDRPTNRVDWIYGTSDVTFSDFAVLDTVLASDHFPIVVTVRIGA